MKVKYSENQRHATCHQNMAPASQILHDFTTAKKLVLADVSSIVGAGEMATILCHFPSACFDVQDTILIRTCAYGRHGTLIVHLEMNMIGCGSTITIHRLVSNLNTGLAPYV
ncbi:uncharacterized protein LOC142586938 [Dermacentor variabilis]|uniref:uncharacterized protein LOC142586938 n=1 Tax=Dermacentor variabilis TaxID=34621 RepID=UPI003F5CA807